jgi:uncharacterized protein
MVAIRETIKRHPLKSYFLLAYLIPWCAILALVGVDGLRSGDLSMSRGMLVWLAMLAGPSVAGILMTATVAGKEGLREFGARLRRWRVGGRWYLTLLVAPSAGLVTVVVLTAFSSDFTPMLVTEGSVTVLVVMFVALVAGASIEELGWTGFATPRITAAFGFFASGLMLGSLHGAWHFLADLSGRGDAGIYYLPRFVVFWLVGLIVLRFLMLWVYEHTESLLLGQLIHASYTAPLFILTPVGMSGAQSLLFWSVFTALFGFVVFGLVFGMKRVGLGKHEQHAPQPA